ncbi:hypothetical protein ACUXPL_001069 [Micrococcus sp. 140720015-1]
MIHPARFVAPTFAAIGALALTACSSASTSSAPTVTATATETVTASATPRAAASTAASSTTPPLVFMARWVPEDTSDTRATEGIVNVWANGRTIDNERKARLPSRHGGVDYYLVTANGATPGMEVSMSVTTITSTPGSVECTISQEGAPDPLIRVRSQPTASGEQMRRAECKAVVPGR